MFLLAAGSNPVQMLYDQVELFAHKGQSLLVELNVAIGTMYWKEGHHGKIAVLEDGLLGHFAITKHVFFMFVVVALILAMFLWARFMGKETKGGAPRGWWNFLEPIILFIRDEVVYPNIKDPHHHAEHAHDEPAHEHKETRKLANRLLPFFVTLFFFVAGMNLIGLIPGSSTPTSSITVTMGLAVLTLSTYVFGALILQGPVGFIKNLVPPCPWALWPLLFAIEFIGLFTKPFALTVRLFANMTAGHCIILSLSGLAVASVAGLGSVGLGLGAVAALGSAAIYCLEVFIALLQAYIFTYLSAIFVGLYLAPEH